MNHTIQFSRECGLASVCIALDLDYKVIYKQFWMLHGKAWADCIPGNAHLCVQYLNSLGVKGDWFSVASNPLTGQPTGPTLKTINLNGRGVLSLRIYKYGRFSHRHAVAFKDGQIFDPSLLYPLPFLEWKKRYRAIEFDGWERLS